RSSPRVAMSARKGIASCTSRYARVPRSTAKVRRKSRFFRSIHRATPTDRRFCPPAPSERTPLPGAFRAPLSRQILMLRTASDASLAGPAPLLRGLDLEGSEASRRLLSSLAEFLRRPDVATDIDEDVLRELFQESRIPVEPEPAENYFAFLIETVLRHATNMSSPRCLGHMTAGVASPLHPLGSLLLGLNPNLVKRA